ncbi:MAG: NADH-quinone oxidoreductase subunit A [Pseudomonadota bacterium]
MDAFLLDYLPIIIFLGIALVLGLGFMIAPALLAPADPDPEKVSTYECGFNAFDDARMKFDIRFYLVAILFIVVDLDISLLFPWAITLLDGPRDFTVFSFWSVFVFIAVFAVGFVYEWKKGALDWE